MDDRRFDALARSMAEPKSRRGFLGAALALAAGAVGGRVGAQTTCPPGQIANRKGDCRCPGGTDACSDGCYDLNRDPKSCGTCGNVCPEGTLCRKGECQCPGRMMFDPILGCVDPRSTTTTTAPTTTTVAPTTTSTTTTTTTAGPTTTTTTAIPTTTTTTTTTLAPGTCTTEADCFSLDEDCYFGRCDTGTGMCFQQPNPAGCAPVDCMVNLNSCPGRDGICHRAPGPDDGVCDGPGGLEGTCCSGDCCIRG